MPNAYQSTRWTGSQIDQIYPVGSIYMSVNNIDPGTLFGGTWEAIENTFLVAQGTNFTAGTSGGASTHSHTTNTGTSGGPSNNTSGGPSNNTSGSTAITIAQMPSHAHTVRIWGDTNSAKAATIGADNGTLTTRTAGARIYKDASSAWVSSNPQSVGNGYGDPAGATIGIGGGGGHTHTLSSHTHTLSSHTHSQTSVGTSSVSNLPPYLAVYMWKRTA